MTALTLARRRLRQMYEGKMKDKGLWKIWRLCKRQGFAQSQGRAFETPEALLAAVGLHTATQRSLRADLQVRSRVLQRLTHHIPHYICTILGVLHFLQALRN